MANPSPTADVFFHIFDGPDQKDTSNDVRIAQPDVLRRRSLTLKELMDNNSASQEKIQLKLDPKYGIDSKAVEWVLENLQREGNALQPEGSCKPGVLAKHCAVLWNYKCNPATFTHLGGSIQPCSSRQSTSPSIDQEGSIAPSTSPSAGSRSWRGKRNGVICGHLITIAIVLGLQNILEEEIKVAVWGTNKTVKTLVPLHKDIKGIRRGELAKLFDKVFEEILAIGDENEKLATRIRAVLKQDGLGNFSGRWRKHPEQLEEWTPYDFLRGIEYELTGSTEPQTQSLEARPQTTRGRDVPDINVVNLIGKMKRKISKTFKPVINGVEVPSERAKINGILETLEAFIGERQQELAADLMKRRNEIVEGWKNKLAELDRSNQKAQE